MASETESVDVAKASAIKKQIEFYFSDSNFRKDTFMKAAAETDPEGFIPIAVLLTFNRLKSITTDASEIAAAVASSETVSVSSDSLKIKRSNPLPEDDTSKERTLYVKGYPTDDASVTIDSISEQFAVFGKITMVRLRKDTDSKSFKGSCFVEYEVPESVAAAVQGSHNGAEVTLTYKDKAFECIMPLKAWLERKQEKHDKRKQKSGGGASSSGVGKSTDDATDDKTAEGKRKRDEDASISAKKAKVEYESGLIIKLTDVPKDADLFQIKDLFKTFGDVKFVEYTSGESEAHIRAANVSTAEAAIQAIEKGLTLTQDGPNLQGGLLTGDDELAYWTKISAGSDRKKSGGGGRGRGGRGGRGWGKGGRGGGRRSRN